MEQTPQKKSAKVFLKSFTREVIVPVVLALIVIQYVIQAFQIPSGSMEDSLKTGDFLLGLKFTYGSRFHSRTRSSRETPNRNMAMSSSSAIRANRNILTTILSVIRTCSMRLCWAITIGITLPKKANRIWCIMPTARRITSNVASP